MKPNSVDWPKKIRTARKKANLTQTALAKDMGIPTQTLRNWEQGNRKPRGIITESFLENHLKNLGR